MNLVKYEGGKVALSDRENEVCTCINLFNQLRDYKLSDIEILEWKDTILRLLPEAEPQAIQFVIERLMTGEIEYKKDEGIRNIFRGLDHIEKEGDKYIVKRIYTY